MMNFADMFSDMPFFDGASMFVNASEICATRKVLQCRDMGTDMADISRKLQGNRLSDIPDDQFKERKRAFQAVKKWVDENYDKEPSRVFRNDWVPILYNYEPARNTAKRNQDWGHLVFVDTTLTHYLLVLCLGPDNDAHGRNAHDQYFELTKYHADRFMSMLKMVFNDETHPDWVRATYTTFTSTIHPEFLNSTDENIPDNVFPPIYQATSTKFTPALTESEIDRIESTMMSSKSWAKHVPPPSVRETVLARQPRPEPIHTAWLGGKSAPESCGFCGGTSTEKKMPQCGKCKIVRYCNKECQRAHWTTHRKYCRSPDKIGSK